MKPLPLILLAGGAVALFTLSRAAATASSPGFAASKPFSLLPDQPVPNTPYVTSEGSADDSNRAWIYRPGSGWQSMSAFDAVQGIFYQGSYSGDRGITNAANLIYSWISDNRPANAGFVWELIV